MKSYRKELWFCVPQRRGIINITPQVEAALRESGIQEGLLLVNACLVYTSQNIGRLANTKHIYFVPFALGHPEKREQSICVWYWPASQYFGRTLPNLSLIHI